MKPKLHQKAGRVLRKASPTILTCIGAVGVVATAVLAVKATPKALRLIEIAEDHRHDDDPNWTWSPLTKTEIIKTTWKCYVPAVVTGAATIICIFGANTLNRRQQASLASAYALLNRSYNDYKRKLKELYGKEAHDNIMKALAVEKADKVDISAWNFCSLSSLEFEGAEEEERYLKGMARRGQPGQGVGDQCCQLGSGCAPGVPRGGRGQECRRAECG